MVELLEGLSKVATDLIRAGAVRPLIGFACFPFSLSYIDLAATYPTDSPHYWLALGFATIVGSVGVVGVARLRTLRAPRQEPLIRSRHGLSGTAAARAPAPAQNTTTLRIDLPSCIRSNARLI